MGVLSSVCHTFTYSSLLDDSSCNTGPSLTSDSRTIVCHPHVKPLPYPETLHSNEGTHKQVLKTKLGEKSQHLEQGPMIEQVSRVLFATKHSWHLLGSIPDVLRNRTLPKTGDCSSFYGHQGNIALCLICQPEKMQPGIFSKVWYRKIIKIFLHRK